MAVRGSYLSNSAHRHAMPLLIVTAVVLLGQPAMLVQRPLVTTSSDTHSYTYAAQLIMTNIHELVQPLRTPGYPGLLAIIFTFFGQLNLTAVVIAQVIVGAITSYELYALLMLITRRPYVSATATAAVSLDLYVLSWERIIYTESLSYWSMVTLLLVFAVLVRHPRMWTAGVFALIGFVAIMVRPAALLLPVALVAMFVYWGWRNHFIGAALGQAALALVITYGLVFGYMEANLQVNTFFVLTYDHNITTFGKVEEFNLQGLATDPRYRGIQADTLAFDAWSSQAHPGQVPDPWTFPLKYPSKNYAAHGYTPMGLFAESIIARYPIPFIMGCLGDVVKTWAAPPTFYSTFNMTPSGHFVLDGTVKPGFTGYSVFNYGPTGMQNEPWWVNTLLIYSTLVQYSYFLLPILLLIALALMWRKRSSTYAFMVAVLLVGATYMIFVAAFGNYAEFYRVRFPMDWSMITAAVVMLRDGGSWLLSRGKQRPSFASLQQQSESTPVPHPGRSHPATSQSPSRPFETRQPVSATSDTTRTLGEAVSTMDAWQAETLRRRAVDPSVSAHFGSFSEPSSVPGSLEGRVEISIVLPCLNEEEAIGGCIDTIQEVIHRRHLNAEILVVDNASTDRSAEIARAHGARVVFQPNRGYGNAYLKGFAEARGQYIVMADADNTYDLNEIEEFVEPLREGYDLVMGNRFAGRMAKGAMTWSHRYIGNPILSGILRLFFHTKIRDAHCGMRAFTKEAYRRMRLRTGGMEFASEMVINAAKAHLKIAERPISYSPRIGESKLNTVRDGWRHLRFMLLYSPTHLFLIPGLVLFLLGMGVMAVLLPAPLVVFGHSWDVHTMMLGSVIAVIGVQVILLGLFARFFSLTEELDGQHDTVLQWLNRWFNLERGLLIGCLIFLVGFGFDAYVLYKWVFIEHLGQLNEIRQTVFATALLAIGAQVFFASFFLSFLQFRKSIHAVEAEPVKQPEPVGIR